jgi:hypothetical protein
MHRTNSDHQHMSRWDVKLSRSDDLTHLKPLSRHMWQHRKLWGTWLLYHVKLNDLGCPQLFFRILYHHTRIGKDLKASQSAFASIPWSQQCDNERGDDCIEGSDSTLVQCTVAPDCNIRNSSWLSVSISIHAYVHVHFRFFEPHFIIDYPKTLTLKSTRWDCCNTQNSCTCTCICTCIWYIENVHVYSCSCKLHTHQKFNQFFSITRAHDKATSPLMRTNSWSTIKTGQQRPP